MINPNGRVFLARRIGQDAWQFPQGGVNPHESLEEAMYRELTEEIGLSPKDVAVLGYTQRWLYYRLPSQFVRQHTKPVVIGQKQRWYLLKLCCHEQKIRLDQSPMPEFDSWRWVDYWHPVHEVIYFKQNVYRRALKELAPLLKAEPPAC